MLPIVYRSNDVGAPTLNNTRGSLIAVLKACLVNGLAARNCTSITRSSTTATVTLTGHGFMTGQNVTIAGCNQSEYNGQKSITYVDANTFTFQVAGSPATPATTGTNITAQLPAAGWTVAAEDAGNYKLLLRNDSVTGSGRFYFVKEDGVLSTDPSLLSAYLDNSWVNIATICGARGYSDINSLTLPFPRLNNGPSLINSYNYGLSIQKGYNKSSGPTNARPWMIIADNRTCHLITTSATDATTSLPTTNTTPKDQKMRGVTSFGDLRSLNPSNTFIPKAFILGGAIGGFGVATGTVGGSNINEGAFTEANFNVCLPDSTIYLDASMENGGNTVSGMIRGEFNNASRGVAYPLGGNCQDGATAEGTYEHYPSNSQFDLTTEKLFLYENMNDPIRTAKTSAQNSRYIHSYIPGLKACPHTTTVGKSYRVGDELSVKTDLAGHSYLLYSLFRRTIATDQDYSGLFAFQLDDWWA